MFEKRTIVIIYGLSKILVKSLPGFYQNCLEKRLMFESKKDEVVALQGLSLFSVKVCRGFIKKGIEMKKTILTTALLTHSNAYIRFIANFLLKNNINEVIQTRQPKLQFESPHPDYIYTFEFCERHCAFLENFAIAKSNNFIIYINNHLAHCCPNIKYLSQLLLHLFYNVQISTLDRELEKTKQELRN